MFLVRRSRARPPLYGSRVPLPSRHIVGQPHTRLSLDPSLQELLREGDISLTKAARNSLCLKELEIIPGDDKSLAEGLNVEVEEPSLVRALERKSPAASYGSERIGQVVLPNQLQNAINILIAGKLTHPAESDKTQLRSDAKRLFYEEGSRNELKDRWNTGYEISKYRSGKQASRHAERDGTAFASIALPAHYSAIVAVLDHAKRRLEPSWKVRRVIDWGVGTGSGLWAALHTFQNSVAETSETLAEEKQVSDSTLLSFLGIDKRDGLVSIGKRLLRSIDLGSVSVSWQKNFKEHDQIKPSEGLNALALSAFMLSGLSAPQQRKALVKEIWESGAHVMVLIDHNTKEGFEAIAQAREYLLSMGRKEFEDTEAGESSIRGSYVVAPCPHDGSCPLYQPASSGLICGFSQRIQRPSFLRRTKHSSVGHEDVEYSYVVIRRGSRPSTFIDGLGRIGEVGRRALEKQAMSDSSAKEFQLHDENQDDKAAAMVAVETDASTSAELQEALRLESFSWPRLVFPPLKKSGHVILDGCTAQGKIMRMTIPKSQGKQPYYDAQRGNSGKGADIGKRRVSTKRQQSSYEGLSRNLKLDKKVQRGRGGPRRVQED